MVENTWRRSNLPRQPAELGKPLVDPAIWHPKDILANDEWIYHLSDTEIAEVEAAVALVVEQGLDIKDITREKFPLPKYALAHLIQIQYQKVYLQGNQINRKSLHYLS